MRRPASAPENDFGLTHLSTYDDMVDTVRLRQQLAARGIDFEVVDLVNIVGVGGVAHLVFYTSAISGSPFTVLVVPHRYDVDRYAEDYYYFESMDRGSAGPDDAARWAELYDRCVAAASRLSN